MTHLITRHAPQQVRRAQHQLHDLHHWTPLLQITSSTATGLHSPRSGRSGGAQDNLPFGLDQAIDDTTLGVSGVHTTMGAVTEMWHWAVNVAGTLNTQERPKRDLSVFYWLTEHAPDAYDQHPDWDSLSEDIATLWRRVATLTGHGTHRLAECPCGGTIRAQATRTGITTGGECDTCETYYPDLDTVAEAYRQHMRTDAVSPTVWVTARQARVIWPTLTATNLRVLAHRGKIARQHNTVSTYRLLDINRHMLRKWGQRDHSPESVTPVP